MAQRRKKHWTQTPKGRALARKNLKKASAASAKARAAAYRAAATPTPRRKGTTHDALAPHTAYCFGYTHHFLDQYAESHGLSRTALARGVGELLLGVAGR